MSIVEPKEEPIVTEDDEGTKYWCLRGKLHREDGPACEYSNGDKEWWIHGERHREDGPAIESYYGDWQWWIHGKEVYSWYTNDLKDYKGKLSEEFKKSIIKYKLSHGD